jgi:lipoyl-dependent peroxiredoxin
MAEIRRRGEARWEGNLRSGRGRVSSESKVLKKEKYSFFTRFENEPGTNPEELIAAAHAACYSMAFAAMLGDRGQTPDYIETHATCILTPLDEGGFAITAMHLAVEGSVPGMDAAAFKQAAKEADKECPVSNLLRPGLDIHIEATFKPSA